MDSFQEEFTSVGILSTPKPTIPTIPMPDTIRYLRKTEISFGIAQSKQTKTILWLVQPTVKEILS